MTAASRLWNSVVALVSVALVLRMGGLARGWTPGPELLLGILVLALVGRTVHHRLVASGTGVGERMGTLLRKRRFAVGLALIVLVYLAAQGAGIERSLWRAPLDVDEGRLARTVSTFFLTGEVPHRTVEDHPGIFYWTVAATYLFTFLALLIQERVVQYSDLSPELLVLVGRWLASLLFAGTIVITGILARRLGGRGGRSGRVTGWLAAFLVALAPMGMQVSAQFRNESAMVLLMVASTLAALGVRRGSGSWWVFTGGMLAGLAAGVKYSGVFALLGVLAAVLWTDRPGRERWRLGLVASLAFGVGLAASNPFLWLNFPNFVRQLGVEVSMTGAEHWSATGNPRGYYLRALIGSWGLPVTALAGAAMVWVIVRRHLDLALLLVVLVPYHLFMSSRPAQFDRWVFPLLPYLACLAAWAATGVIAWVRDRSRAPSAVGRPVGRLAAWAPVALFAVLLLPMLARATVHVSRLLAPQTYDRVESWLAEEIPAGERVVIEEQWLDLDGAGLELTRVPSLSALLDDELRRTTFDWVVVPEPYLQHPALQDRTPEFVVRGDYGLWGSRGWDFAVYRVGPAEPVRSLDLDMRGPRARRYLADGWGEPDPRWGRRIVGPARVLVPLDPGGDHRLELEIARPTGSDIPGDARPALAVNGVDWDGAPFTCGGWSGEGGGTRSCAVSVPGELLRGGTDVLSVRPDTGSALWVVRLVVERLSDAPAGRRSAAP